jgi:hypothetical protein
MALVDTPSRSSHTPTRQAAKALGGPSASPAQRMALAAIAVVALALALLLAAHHPTHAPLVLGAALTASVVFYVWPAHWLAALPALVPLIGFAPWTGWITFEELDVLILAIAAGGYARRAWAGGSMSVAAPARAPDSSRGTSKTGKRSRQTRQATLWPWLLVGLFCVSSGVALWRGFLDAGGFVFGWYQGYHEPMNSVRLAKCFFEALLLLPLWRGVQKQSPEQASHLLSMGLMLGLAGASLGAIWERLAFTGLMNFSADYRTTSTFWEMHVGGAALDGFLALTMPFAVRELLLARTPQRWALAATVTALASYACLTTFSRGVYLAIPLGLAIYFVLKARQQATAEKASNGFLPGAVLALAFAACAAIMFDSAGYRGVAALMGAAVLMLPLARVLRQLQLPQWLAGLGLGVAGTLALGAVAWLVPKGAYLVYALALLGAALACAKVYKDAHNAAQTGKIKKSGKRWGALALAGFIGTLGAVVMVAVNWGEAKAAPSAVVSVVVVLGIALASALPRPSKAPMWPDNLRWQAGLGTVMAVTVAFTGVFSGGAYMGNRFSTGGQDLTHRIEHWTLGASFLETPADWWLGKGHGRFPANFFLVGDPGEHPGDYRLRTDATGTHVRLTGGLHVNDGWGQVLRLTQRVGQPASPARASAQVMTDKDTRLLFEVCEKHLIYSGNCVARDMGVKAKPGQWQTVEADLPGDRPSRGAWYAPNLIAFSVAVGTGGSTVALGKITLAAQDGSNLLANADFSNGMAHWFFSSDRHHLPWHIKNMGMHVLFDQGIMGLALASLLSLGALLRLSIGRAKYHPLAPAIAASLVGFGVVGLFDSLLDVPRIAVLAYALLLIGLTLRGSANSVAGSFVPVPIASSAVATSAPVSSFVPTSAPNPAPANGLDVASTPGTGSRTSARSPSRARSQRSAKKRTRFAKAMWAVVALLLVLGVALVSTIYAVGSSPSEVMRRSPAEVLRQSKVQLIEKDLHNGVLWRVVSSLQAQIERPPPAVPLPTLGKGQQAQSLPPQRYTAAGEPVPVTLDAKGQFKTDSQAEAAGPATQWVVTSGDELARAMASAVAGQVINIKPGNYAAMTVQFVTKNPGTPQQPITVRADKPGAVKLEFGMVEGFHVTQPFWVFENLNILGVCSSDGACEHAFHVVGAAKGTVLRNNRVEDFNAHVKINGEGGLWPDNGLLQFNTLSNSRPRKTKTPVTPVDLVAASAWLLADNHVVNFARAGGNAVSYGLFMKGAGSNGRIERNLIVCTTQDISQPGERLGISFGGGGTDRRACRDKFCVNEHTGGLAANNIIAHCNDAGLDVNNSIQTLLAHNTLINTAGILTRGTSSEVTASANLLDGRIRAIDGTRIDANANEVGNLNKRFVEADELLLTRKPTAPGSLAPLPQVPGDFCNAPRPDKTLAGATGVDAALCAPR